MKRVTAQVDAVSDLIPGFLARKRGDARTILSCISCQHVDFQALSAIGHKLKGEGGSYGLDLISSYGAEIEQAAINCDAAAIRR